MKRVALLITLASCGSEKSPPAPAPAPVQAVAVVADANIAAPPASPPKAEPTVKLPAKGFDFKQVLGARRAQVAKILGNGTPDDDGILRYEFGKEDVDQVLVRVEHDEKGKAGLVAITTSMYPRDMTASDREAVLAWAGATTDDEWYANDSSIELWDADALARAKERKRVGGLLGDYVKQIGAGSGHARGEMTTQLLVRVPYGTTCTRTLLTKYREEFVDNVGVDLRGLGFTAMTCDLDGVVLKLR